ncbi:DUF927 domain-containing protein [Vibrio cholerae]|uniref:DUF927 domain-containing protein n=1 Tax=Vibrio cholerae TaxID=666 RepID=UPI0039761D2A
MNLTIEKRDEGLMSLPEGAPPELIAGPISVKAHTYDPDFKKGFGILIQWRSRVGEHHERVFKMKDILADGGRSMIQTLADTGLYIHYRQGYWKHIIDYILSSSPTDTVVTVDQTGWYYDQFVTPSWVAGFSEQEVIFQNDSAEKLSAKGTFMDWQESVARLCQNNALMTFSLCSAFAAPLLSKLDWDSFLVHFLGSSKHGKTTLLRLAASVCSDFNYCDSWSSTSNGLEARAKSRNNMIVLLDEFQQADPESVLTGVYQLGNGTSKLRATKSANLQEQYHWNIVGLSTGEIGLAQVLAQANRKVQAGQLMRFFEIPLFQKYGAFEHIHELNSAKEFAEHIAQVTSHQHGTALQPFLNQVASIDDIREKLTSRIKSISSIWFDCYELTKNNQISFAADRFAFIASVGELAIELGALPWSKGSAIMEIGKIFEVWVANQDEDCDFEERHIKNQLRQIIPKWQYSMSLPGEIAKNGWWRYERGELCWHIHRDAFKRAFKLHFDHQVIQTALFLKRQGWLYTNEPARGTFKSNVSGRAARNFKIFPARITEQLDLDVDFSRFQKGGEA